jgi:hypothetical protein
VTTPARRRATRVELGVPVQVFTRTGTIDIRLFDISRTGLRLRAHASALGIEKAADIEATARAVGELLASEFTLNLDYEKFGPLLNHSVHLTRVGIPNDAPLFVDICCAFDEPIGDAEVAILGTELPPLAEEPADWLPPRAPPEGCEGVVNCIPVEVEDEAAPAEAAAAPEPVRPPARPALAPVRHRYRAIVTGVAKDAPPSFFCHTDLVTAIGVRIGIPRPPEAVSVTAALNSLTRAHHQGVQLRILNEDGDVWSGPARVSGVELPPDNMDTMLVTLAFDPGLSMAAMRGLGLLGAA